MDVRAAECADDEAEGALGERGASRAEDVLTAGKAPLRHPSTRASQLFAVAGWPQGSAQLSEAGSDLCSALAAEEHALQASLQEERDQLPHAGPGPTVAHVVVPLAEGQLEELGAKAAKSRTGSLLVTGFPPIPRHSASIVCQVCVAHKVASIP